MRNLLRSCIYGLILAISTACVADDLPTAGYRVARVIEIDTVPSWFPVGFCLLSHGDQQYVAYYNDQHQMIVARRQLAEDAWQKVELPSKVGWDSHNYVTMAIDSAGHLHLAGNMHGVPLIYFRTRTAGDIATFERLPMTGQEEQRVTYPRFLTTPDDQLLFMYRSGGSGNGRRFFNAYDEPSQTWTRFLDTPMFDGQGQRNAYPRGPARGPDGRFHVVWVWRDTPDCATNNHLCYARSSDLKHWENAAGEPVALPFVLEQSSVWVDPIPSGGGIINGCQSLAFDSEHRPVIAYHKSDEDGHMQVYVARIEKGRWQPRPITNWAKNITFGGGGAMPFIGISLSPLTRLEPDRLTLTYRHRDYGSGRIVLDEATLQPVAGSVAVPDRYPPEIRRPTIDFDGIRVRLAADQGVAEAGKQYVLRWEVLDANHDRRREPPLPPPSTLQLIELEP
jgi:hypothetical protein